ncbi:Vacuolar protein sorting-associated protein 16 [Blastocladiella emersonii ATCC 22665]|nr:Vacuolar protein sorting-associated protein 16 [Blastocladiella emersonii ATCC 22665]
MTAAAREGWIPLGDSVLCQRRLYELDWDLTHFDHLHVAVSTTGSFVGTARNEAKPHFAVGATTMSVPLAIHSAKGELVRAQPWDREHASIIKLGWTDDERLVVLLNDATVRLYPLYGDPAVFSLGEEVKDSGIHSAEIWPSGLAVLTKAGQFVVVRSWRDQVPRVYRHFKFAALPNCWSYTPEANTTSGSVELVAQTLNSVKMVSEMDYQELEFPPLQRIRVSPNANFWASVTNGFKLELRLASSMHVTGSLDLQTVVDCDLNDFDLVWCGEEAVLVSFSEALVFFHISGEHYVIDLFEPVTLSPALESCFQITSTDVTLFSIVPYATQNIFKIGSTHPGAVLMDAVDHYNRKSAQSVDLLEELLRTAQLRGALTTCLEAAMQAWEPKVQRSLLTAVQFGRAWVASEPAAVAGTPASSPPRRASVDAAATASVIITIRDALVRTGSRLRVLNALRAAGFPVSDKALDAIGDAGMVRLLVAARKHLLAFRIAEFLELDRARAAVVTDWTKLKIAHARDFDVDLLVGTIVDRLRVSAGGSDGAMAALDFSDLAVAAHAAGHVAVATRLVDFETQVAKKVPLLLEMQQPQLALAKAISTFDKDLVYLVLIYLRKSLKLTDFLRAVHDCPGALPYLEQYARENDRTLLRDFYFLEDRHVEMGNLILEDVETAETTEEKLALLREATAAFARTKRAAAQQRMVESQVDLLHQQAQLATRFPANPALGIQPYESLSLDATLVQLIRTGHMDEAAKLRTRIAAGVSEKRWAWTVVRGLAAARDWPELEKFAAASRRPAIGHLPFVRACVAAGVSEEAKKYMYDIVCEGEVGQKCDIKLRVEQYEAIGAITEAAQVASQLGDMPKLVELRRMARDGATAAAVDELIAALRRK